MNIKFTEVCKTATRESIQFLFCHGLTWSAWCCHQLGLVLEPMRPALCRVAELLLLLVSRLLDDDTSSSAAHRFSCLACWDDGVHTALGTDIPLSVSHRRAHCTSATQQRGKQTDSETHYSPVDAFLQTLWEAGPCLCAWEQPPAGGATRPLDPATLAALLLSVLIFPDSDKRPDSKDILSSSLRNVTPSNTHKDKESFFRSELSLS
jgi:hypothetical protein